MAYDYDAGLPLSPKDFVPHRIPNALAEVAEYPMVGWTVRPTSEAVGRGEPMDGGIDADEVATGCTYRVVATGTGVVYRHPELLWLVVRNAPSTKTPVCRYLTARAWERHRVAFGSTGGDSAWKVVPE